MWPKLSRFKRPKSRSTALSRNLGLLRKAVAQQALSSDKHDYMTTLGALSLAEAAAEMGNDAQSAEYFKQAVSDEPANIIRALVSSLGLMEISRLMLRDIFSTGVFKPT